MKNIIFALILILCTACSEYEKDINLVIKGGDNYEIWQSIWYKPFGKTNRIYSHIEFVKTKNIDSVYKNRISRLNSIIEKHKLITKK